MTFDVVAKLFATGLIVTICSGLFFAGINNFPNDFISFSTINVAAKNLLSCSE